MPGAPGVPRPREKEGRRETVRGGLERGQEPADGGRLGAFGVETVPPGSRGREVPGVACPSLRTRTRVRALGQGRVGGSEAWEAKALEGQKPRRGSAVGSGQPVPARTDSQEDEGFEVDEAGGTGRFCRSGSRVTESAPSGARKGAHSRRGNQTTARESAEVGETGGNKAPGVASPHARGQRQGSMWPREGCAIPARGRL
jgi:hypothetical protein